ncbi:MAG TPA: penicillin-binding transpeptidase domain-containing protein [Clostridia bacterium]|nr:penicillin-binding transpeptidase domain-containing protein [Clostridia bacterium]
MLKHLKERNIQFGIICIICLSVLAGQLAYLTVEKGDELYAKSLVKKRVELKLKGTRGNIVDRYGIPVAVNRQIYTVQLDRQLLPSNHGDLNNIILQMLEIIYKNGDKDTLLNLMPIRLDPDTGKLRYTWDDEEKDIRDKRYDSWIRDIGIQDRLSPEEMLEYLRKERYEIDDEIADETAIHIISIRLNIHMRRFTQYEPIPVAEGIGPETVVQLETFAPEMPGVQTLIGSGRYYPMDESFSQIVGYLGSISKDQIEDYKEQGYDISSDKIGQVGVESYGEEWLTGNKGDRLGKLTAEKDSFGKVIRVLDETSPQNGHDVVLTIDSQLQNSVGNILKEEIEKMREGLPPYEERNIAPLAEEGAAVVLDVNTGEVLSLVSYPSFDPNSSGKDGKQFSLAYQGTFMPGSVFKMLIGIAGLMEGAITLNERIYDKVYYTKYDTKRPPSCNRKSGHGWESYTDALKHSCNYFFYEVADRVGVEAITKWAELFGLDGMTGIEILSPDRDKNAIPSEETKIRAHRPDMRRDITRIMKRYGYFDNELSEEQRDQVEQLIDFPLSKDRSREAGLEEVRKLSEMIEAMGYTEKVNQAADEIRRDVLSYYKRWTPSDTIRAGIGQGYVDISPLAMARYIATIANGGKVLETHIVKKVVDSEGKTVKETQPTLIRELEVNQEYLEATLKGMWMVANDPNPTRGENDGGGTAAEYFKDLAPEITVAGKTGTAQTVSNDPNKNNAWFVSVTPYENPEIAVVVAIPNGRTAGNAAPVARRIIEEYYRLNGQRQENTLPTMNQVQP